MIIVFLTSSLIVFPISPAHAGTGDDPALTVSISPSAWSMDVGQSKVFTAVPIGGSGNYTSYQWYFDTSLQTGQNASTYNYQLSANTGTYSIAVTVNDSSGSTSAQSPLTLITVNPSLVAPTASANWNSSDQGQTIILYSSTVTTGTSPYQYQWLQEAPEAASFSPISGATSSSYPFVTNSSTTIGSWSFQLQVTDSASEVVTSNTAAFTLNVAPTVSISPGSANLNIEQTQVFTATPSGGTGNYTFYHWYVNGVSQGFQMPATFSFTPGSLGSYSITAAVSDNASTTSVQSTAATVTVSATATPTPTPIPTASPTSAPTATPTAVPTATPTQAPTASPTTTPTNSPTPTPTSTSTSPPTAGTFVFTSLDGIITAIVIVIIALALFLMWSRRSKNTITALAGPTDKVS